MIQERGSRQLRRYLMAREHGHARADAAAYAGIGLGEAELIDRDKGWGEPLKVRN